jgi:hypothetical protein
VAAFSGSAKADRAPTRLNVRVEALSWGEARDSRQDAASPLPKTREFGKDRSGNQILSHLFLSRELFPDETSGISCFSRPFARAGVQTIPSMGRRVMQRNGRRQRQAQSLIPVSAYLTLPLLLQCSRTGQDLHAGFLCLHTVADRSRSAQLNSAERFESTSIRATSWSQGS